MFTSSTVTSPVSQRYSQHRSLTAHTIILSSLLILEIQQYINPLNTNALKTKYIRTKSREEMARRIINKACNDLVGGAGTDVSMSIGPEIQRKTSVLKIASKDVGYGNRQAAEIRPSDGRQVPKGPIQMAHPHGRDEVKPEEEVRKPHFVNIDADGSPGKQVDVQHVQQSKAVPQTAYKMRSFMSTVETGQRGHPRPPTQVNPNPVKPPPPSTRRDTQILKNQPEDTKMFLPKGIHRTDQPYVVPKFMPSYREMMAPKPKPDPLVSIVETTPPSLQKWAVEWNNEPKKTISIDELREDLIREAAEKPHKPQGRRQRMSPIHESTPDETQENEKPDQLVNNQKKQPSYAEPIKENLPNVSGSTKTPPWNDLHIPTSFETMGEQGLRDPAPKKQEIGRPLVDWVPLKYSSSRGRPHDSRLMDYSFQEAIKNGTPMNTSKSEIAEPKQFLPRPAENAVHFDTEEQKFHQWFKQRMSAAAQTAVNQASKAPPMNADTQSLYSNINNPLTFKGLGKLSNMTLPVSPSRQNQPAQAEPNCVNSINQSENWKDLNGMIPPEVRDHPKPVNKVSAKSYEPERNSSFYHWLKLRGHVIVKNEPNPKENKKEEKTNQNLQNGPRFPWSVSYTLRKRVSTPTVVNKRPAPTKNLKKSQIVSQNGIALKPVKSSITKSFNHFDPDSIRSEGKKFHKTISKRSIKSAGKRSAKSAGKVSSTNVSKNQKMSQPEPPRVTASADHLWINDGWNVSSEIDHINNLRKMEIFGNISKATNMKKLFPSLGGSQMKYWESKYIKKSTQNQRSPRSVDSEAKPNPYSWFISKKATDGIKNTIKDVLTVNHAGNGADTRTQRSTFSPIDEHSSFPLNLSQTAKDEVMDISDDFDVDNFLFKEEAEEKALLESTQGVHGTKAKAEEKTEDQQTAKMKGKEHIKFPRSVKAHPEAKAVDLRQRVQQQLDEDECVLALGDDPGMEDLEWSEFIGPRNSLDQDSDLTRLIGAQARQLSSMQNSCL